MTNPWEAALSPDGKRLYTIYAGTNDMNVSEVIDDDYREIERLGRAVSSAKIRGPSASAPMARRSSSTTPSISTSRILDADIAAPARRGQAVRAAQDAGMGARQDPVQHRAPSDELARAGWRAPRAIPMAPAMAGSGTIPKGLRKTPSLVGLAHTHPLHWSADRDEVQDFEYTIRGRLMQGAACFAGRSSRRWASTRSSSTKRLAGRSKDLDALAIYTNSFDFALSPHIPAPGKLSASRPARQGAVLQ